MASEVDIPLVSFIDISIALNVRIVADYKIGVSAAVPRLYLESTSIKSTSILIIGRCVELKLVLLVCNVGVLLLDQTIVICVPELRVICVLVFIIWDPFHHSIALGGLLSCTAINLISKVFTSTWQLVARVAAT